MEHGDIDVLYKSLDLAKDNIIEKIRDDFNSPVFLNIAVTE